jgi:SNF2 family DNA or RNA helicase
VNQRGNTVDQRDAESSLESVPSRAAALFTSGGLPVHVRVERLSSAPGLATVAELRLHLEHLRLSLVRGFDELLCLEGLQGVEHLPHQIETVRRVLRHFHGRVLLADEVGLGKTIEACLLLREYLLRGLVRRVLILVPAPLVSQWQEELSAKFGLQFTVASKTGGADGQKFWEAHELVLSSHSLAKTASRARLVSEVAWDLVIVDEAHHCKNRSTRNWQLVNSLKRRHLFLLTATPVQNNLVELFNLLTLLEPGHLRTESDFKKNFVTRGNPRDPRNRQRLRQLLGEVMVRNTRSLVQMDLPPRYAQTLVAQPAGDERRLHELVDAYLRKGLHQRDRAGAGDTAGPASSAADGDEPSFDETTEQEPQSAAIPSADARPHEDSDDAPRAPLKRMQLARLLAAHGSHPVALLASLAPMAEREPVAAEIVRLAGGIARSAKDEKLLGLLDQSQGHKTLVFVNFRRTLHRLQELLTLNAMPHSVFSGDQSDREKDAAVAALRDDVHIMLCTDSGGEGRNLQFADTVVNYDLPWNPMRIEQRVGRVHRIGQTRDVFVFNLCTAGSLEARILRLLNEKIRMFELVVGEVGSILGNLEGDAEFESVVLNLWARAANEAELEQSFESFGESLLEAQQRYVQTKELDAALFGEDYE